MSERKPKDERMGLRIDADLKKWAQDYADGRKTTLSQLLIDHLVALRQKEQRKVTHGR